MNRQMPRILAIETTCDETAAAVFTEDAAVLSSVVASQADLHARYGGVVPEIASRAHLTQLLPVVDEALRQAETKLSDLSAIAVAYTPGLIGSILVGLSAAKTLAATLDIPLIGVNHLEGHIYACQMAHGRPAFPCIGLVVSGGHTNLFHCRSASELQLIGATVDDAAGEAFDKVSILLELGYPGGPKIETTAKTGNPKAFDFPRTFLHDDNLDFSFSGLKTAVLYAVRGQNAVGNSWIIDRSRIPDVAASFQKAVVDVLVSKCKKACQQTGVMRLCVGGGVAANTALRQALETMAKTAKIDLLIAPPQWCTDNAAMAAVAVEKFKSGRFDPLDLDAVSGLIRKAS